LELKLDVLVLELWLEEEVVEAVVEWVEVLELEVVTGLVEVLEWVDVVLVDDGAWYVLGPLGVVAVEVFEEDDFELDFEVECVELEVLEEEEVVDGLDVELDVGFEE